MVGLAGGLVDAILFAALQGRWLPFVCIVSMFAAAFACIGCLDIASRSSDAIGWGVIFGVAVLLGVTGVRLFGVSTVGWTLHLALCLAYAASGAAGMLAASRKSAA